MRLRISRFLGRSSTLSKSNRNESSLSCTTMPIGVRSVSAMRLNASLMRSSSSMRCRLRRSAIRALRSESCCASSASARTLLVSDSALSRSCSARSSARPASRSRPTALRTSDSSSSSTCFDCIKESSSVPTCCHRRQVAADTARSAGRHTQSASRSIPLRPSMFPHSRSRSESMQGGDPLARPKPGGRARIPGLAVAGRR